MMNETLDFVYHTSMSKCWRSSYHNTYQSRQHQQCGTHRPRYILHVDNFRPQYIFSSTLNRGCMIRIWISIIRKEEMLVR